MRLGAPPPTDFALSVDRAHGRTTVRVRGELDLHTAPQLGELLRDAGGARDLVVDLTEVELIDSTALGVLLAAARRRPDARLDVLLVRTDLRRIFTITGLERFFSFGPAGEAR